MPCRQYAEAVRTLRSSGTSLQRDGNEFTPLRETQRESLDTERITFTMFNLWQETIECDTIAKLSENFWSNGCRTI
jgi:hypothetical protein